MNWYKVPIALSASGLLKAQSADKWTQKWAIWNVFNVCLTQPATARLNKWHWMFFSNTCSCFMTTYSRQQYSGLSWMIKCYYIQDYPKYFKGNIETRTIASNFIWSSRQMRQNNLEDLYSLKNDDGINLFSESEIKNYTHQYCKQLWSNYIESKTDIYQEIDWMKVMDTIKKYNWMKWREP